MSKTTRKQAEASHSRSVDTLGTVATPTLAPSEVNPRAPVDVPGSPNISPRDTESMARLSVHFDGRNYRYQAYEYGPLADALAYARLMQSRHRDEHASVSRAQECPVQSPSDSQRQLMRQLSISVEAGTYRLGGCRYDNLADAVSYAGTCLRRYLAANPKLATCSRPTMAN